MLIGWTVGLCPPALIYGAVIPTIPELVASNPDIRQRLGISADAEQELIDALLRYIALFTAVISTGFGLSSGAACARRRSPDGPRPCSPSTRPGSKGSAGTPGK